jgi:hypothetical protein
LFLIDVHETATLLHYIRAWHVYTSARTQLRRTEHELVAHYNQVLLRERWAQWKEIAKDAIYQGALANRAFREKWRRTFISILLAFHDAAHSRRVCRRDVEQKFRYFPNGPFQLINDHYDWKRSHTIPALHFRFMRLLPRMLHLWQDVVRRYNDYRARSRHVGMSTAGLKLREWYDIYRDHFHRRVLSEVRLVARRFRQKIHENSAAEAKQVENTLMLQLVRDKKVLDTKLQQFDRLAQIHAEAVSRRRVALHDCGRISTDYFKRHEELQLFDFERTANDIWPKVREVRKTLAEAWVYHVGRVANSYENQQVAEVFCTAFRGLAEPIVDQAFSYFHEKRAIRRLLASFCRHRRVLGTVVGCTATWHRLFGLQVWQAFMDRQNEPRTKGLMERVRRRRELLMLYPYFNYVEIIEARPPRPIKEVEQMFKDLPQPSIQRKLARERDHHVAVRLQLAEKRLKRDFFRAFASYVQEARACAEVMALMSRRRAMRLKKIGFNSFRAYEAKSMIVGQLVPDELRVSADLAAWFRHLIHERARQRRLVSKLQTKA